MIPLQILSKIIKILRSGATPAQIAGGFVLGMMIGLSPSFLNPLNLIPVILLVILNVNLTSAIFAYAIFSAVAYFLDPFFHSLGYFLLVGSQILRGLWTTLYNIPFIPFTRFNNTVVMGSFVSALILLLPVYLGTKKFVVTYRVKYESKVQNWKWVKMIKATKLFHWYEKLKFLGD